VTIQPIDFLPAPGECPICAGRADPAGRHRPFCSERCRWIDLGRWFEGAYRVPQVEPADDEQEDARGAAR
jgi:hypothetical protein